MNASQPKFIYDKQPVIVQFISRVESVYYTLIELSIVVTDKVVPFLPNIVLVIADVMGICRPMGP